MILDCFLSTNLRMVIMAQERGLIKRMFKICIFFICFNSIVGCSSQNRKYWSSESLKNNIDLDKGVARISFPKNFRLFRLDVKDLRKDLFKIVDKEKHDSLVVVLPNIEGNLEEFQVFENSGFSPELQEKFPEIRSFDGKGITDKRATLKLSYSPEGIKTMVFRTDKENEFIEVYSKDLTIYAVFTAEVSGELKKILWSCTTK